MTNPPGPDMYVGRTAVDPQGNKIGTVGQVYLNDQTGQPDWITVNTGLFGLKENFAPLAGSGFDGEDLVLPFDKDVVKDSPDIADSSHLDHDEQDALYGYYQQYLGAAATGPTRTTVPGQDAGYGQEPGPATAQGDPGYRPGTDRNPADGAARPADQAMTRSEEQLQVGTEQVETGRARLRKYVVTEQQTVQVPVTREEVRIEREPITDDNRDAALTGPDIAEQEHEVVLHEERPVVQTEAVPVERVRLGTETVTEQQSITGQVRKEQIEVDDPTTTR